jgi:hypothetical protein
LVNELQVQKFQHTFPWTHVTWGVKLGHNANALQASVVQNFLYRIFAVNMLRSVGTLKCFNTT